MEIIFKIDSTGQYAGINNYESIIYQLTKDIDEKFIKKIKKENPNVKLNWEQVIESYKENIKSSVKLYNSNIEFFFRFNNIFFYKGKSYFSNVRERSKSSDFSLPMRKVINFSEDDIHYILKVNYNLENQYLQSQDYAFYFFNRFPNYETFKKEYKEESEGNYLFDKKTCLPTYIELKSELTYDVKGNKSYSTKIFKILN